MDIFTKLANFKARNDALESLNEQKDAVIARLNDECEIHAANNVKLRDEIANVRKSRKRMLETATRLNRSKNDRLVKIYREKQDAVIAREETENKYDEILSALWTAQNNVNAYRDEMNAMIRENKRITRRSERRQKRAELWKNRAMRIKNRLTVMTEVANEWQEIAQGYKRERDEQNMIARSYGRTISEQDEIIRKLRAEIKDMRSGGNELHNNEPEMQDMICGPEILIDFNTRPDIIGYAPCGNGCPVKRDISGRTYDDHEITCEDSPEFSGIDL